MFDRIHSIIGQVAGDERHLQNSVKLGEFHTIAELLPYRTYDDVEGIYYNENSIGFILECAPLVGADEKMVKTITSMVKHDIPEGGSVQFFNYASPKVSPLFDEWVAERQKTGGVYKRLAESRRAYLEQFVWKPFFEKQGLPRGFVIRDFQIFIAASLPIRSTIRQDKDSLIVLRSSMETTLNNLNMHSRPVTPQRFINFLDEIINMDMGVKPSALPYCELTPINKQISSPETKIEVQPNQILIKKGKRIKDSDVIKLDAEDEEEIEVRSLTVRKYPEAWSQAESTNLIGDFHEDMLQIPCPFITLFSFTVPNTDKARAKAFMKATRAVQQASTGLSKYMPELVNQSRDWQFVKSKLKDGQKIVQSYYQVTIFAPKGKGNAIENSVRDLYGSLNWQLVRDKYMHMQSFMACLPFMLSEGLSEDLDRLGRLKAMVSWTCANVAPLQGEWKGLQEPYLLLIGRRGQPLFFNPFSNKGGNHNVGVIGKSGSGKSVTMQDLVASMRGAGGSVIVIDDGHSFEHSCKMQGGAFVEFSDKNKICFNPFSMLDEVALDAGGEYVVEVMTLINSLVRQMCREMEATSDIENSFIEKAITKAWQEKRRKATMTTVRDILLGYSDPRAQDLGKMLGSFAVDGRYGMYFEGDATISLTNPLMVFELSELKSRKHLQGVVMMLLMFISTEEMRKDRTVNTSLIIDEAWDLLHGKATGAFIEGVARRARKYGGNLVTGTQSMNDYYKNAAAQAAIENTDWYIFLAQKPESIAQIKKSERIALTPWEESVMKSLRVVENKYSEVMIKGPGVTAVGRLILDKYSMALYSSTGKVYAGIQSLVDSGMSLDDAIQKIADGMAREA